MIQNKNNLRISDFFINSLSYAFINKNKNIPISTSIKKNKYILNETKDWLKNIIRRKHFSSDIKLPKLIYYIFPDREVVKNLESVFENVDFEDYLKYYKFCYKHIFECYNAEKFEFFSYINFFHLIGSFRFFSTEIENKQRIEDKLYEILNEDKFHPLIKYSALQLSTSNTLEKDWKSNDYANYTLFKKEYLRTIHSIEKGGTLTKYISFYAIFYYGKDYNFKTIVNKHLENIVQGNEVNKEKLHTYLPQLTALLIRLNKDLYFKTKTNQKFIDLFESSSLSLNSFIELKKKIITDYKIT